jgi:transcriptional/translational regulatory protein YebC/TACO1
MKTIIRTGIMSFMGILLLSNLILGQETTATAKNPSTGNVKFTEEQKAMIKATRAKQAEFKNAFKKTLSSDQLNLRSDPRLTRYDRIKSFRASFTDDQVALIREHQKQMAEQRKLFRSSLTDIQKKQLRMIALNKMRLRRHQMGEAL